MSIILHDVMVECVIIADASNWNWASVQLWPLSRSLGEPGRPPHASFQPTFENQGLQ